MRSLIKGAFLAAMLLTSVQTVWADECATGVSSAFDAQRQKYIAATADMASQNFSKRPGPFATTTCLDNLMTSGGLDIFFKPPSLDNILNMVKNLACQQAGQIFASLLSGSGINASSLQPGEILAGLNLNGNLLSSLTSSSSSSSSSVTSLISSLLGTSSTSTTTASTVVDSSLKSVFK